MRVPRLGDLSSGTASQSSASQVSSASARRRTPSSRRPLRLGTSRLKPAYQGYKRLQVAVDSGAS
eukprot:6753075-Alexandrium_andersonii.AAC.1